MIVMYRIVTDQLFKEYHIQQDLLDKSAAVSRLCVTSHSSKLSICPLFVRDYVRSELESGYEGPVYLEPLSMNRFTTALIGMTLHGNA